MAKKYFKALFESGVRIAQLRTKLGILGFETKGPGSAAEVLFEVISEKMFFVLALAKIDK